MAAACQPTQMTRMKNTPSTKCPLLAGKMRGFDRTAGSEDNCLYVNPVEVRQARSQSLGYTDGAKIYFCNRRCCFLTGKRRSSLLDWLSPRKSRFSSHTSKMRSIPERGSGHDEPVSARRSVCDRRWRGDGPRFRALRALHAREAFPRQ